MVNGAHKPELDNLTPAQTRVLCEELFYTMDCEQRFKIAVKLPGLYQMVFGDLPDSVKTHFADQLSEHRSPEVKKLEFERFHDAVTAVDQACN